MPRTGAIIQSTSSSMNQFSSASIAEKKMIETPVNPLITTCVVDIGRAKISTFTSIKAEHIYVEPKTMKPSLKLTSSLIGIVFVTVYSRVNLLIESMPMASKKVARPTRVASFAFLLTYAIPMIFEREIAPIQTPVRMAKTKLVQANKQEEKSSLVTESVVPQYLTTGGGLLSLFGSANLDYLIISSIYC